MKGIKRTTKSNILHIVLIIYILVSALLLLNTTNSRYITVDEMTGNATVALFNPGVTIDAIGELHGAPGSMESFNIIVTNYKNDITSDIAIKYTLKVEKLEDNLPLEIYIEDETGVYLGEQVTGQLPANENKAETYKIVAKWNSNDNDIKYQGRVDAIRVYVETEQID